MSDHPGTGFALGYLAAGSATELAREGALTLTRALQSHASAPATIDVGGILQIAQETEDYIQKLERNTEALRQEIRELRAHSARVEDDRDRLYAWAKWAEDELKRRPKAD